MKSLPIFLISLFFLFSISTAEEKNEKIETPFLNWIINTMEAAAQTVSNTQAKNAKSKDAQKELLAKLAQVVKCIENIKEIQQMNLSNHSNSMQEHEAYYHIAKQACLNFHLDHLFEKFKKSN